MKRTNKAAYFFSGMLTALLLISMVTPALAAGLSKRIEVFTGASVYVDDVKLDPRDANGNPVDVFIYNGTTYLPIRAISNSLDIPIQWEGSTKSVYVGKHTGDKPAVWLTNLDYYAGTKQIYTADSQLDNLGETHYHCISTDLKRSYMINGQYTRLTGVLYQKYKDRSIDYASGGHLWVYGDGELLYSYELTAGVHPVTFDIDISGVLDLKIDFDASYTSWSTENIFSLGDVGLWT